MKTIAAIFGSACVSLLSLVPDAAMAQATRTWVSGVGDDVNPCSRTAPCKTFAGAISKTFINGEINCLDPGGFGTVTITKSITIDCHEIFASILASGTTGITISIATGNANDPLRTVRLRNLNLNGAGASGTVGTRTGIRGINITNAAAVFIEDMLISDFANEGIRDARTGGGKLFINNTTIRNNAGTGIALVATGGNLDAVVDSSRSMNNNFGIAAGSANRVLIRRSVFSGNAFGVEADPGGTVSVNDSAISSNGTGVLNAGTIRLSNNDITLNTTAFNGATTTFGNNRILDNGSLGTGPTPAGGASSNLGQQ